VTDFAALKAAVDSHLSQATYWKATSKLGKGYAVAYSFEAAQLRSYVDALARGEVTPAVPSPQTEHGKGLLGIIQAGLATTPAPGPDPTPTPTPTPAPSGVLPFRGFSPGSTFTNQPTLQVKRAGLMAQATPGGLVRVDYLGDGNSDQAVQHVFDAGLHNLLVIGGTLVPTPTPAQHAAAAKYAATKWAPNVLVWELGGNEPNLRGITPQTHVDLLLAAAAAVRAVDPNAIITNGGLAGSNDYLVWAAAIAQALKQIGGRIAFNSHLYELATIIEAWNNWARCWHPEALSGQKCVRQILDDLGLTDVPIIGTEAGYHPSDRDQATQAQYITAGYADFATRRKTRTFTIGDTHLIYSLDEGDSLGYFGVVDPSTYAPYPGFKAMQAAVR
jgi:hypothetical protein